MTRSNTFERLGVIGRGLTGTVYKARMRDGTLVALKVLDADKQRDRMVFGYFTNEKVVLKRIVIIGVIPISWNMWRTISSSHLSG
jgi:Protein tyrosine kinase.